jgi:hypothetical protein
MSRNIYSTTFEKQLNEILKTYKVYEDLAPIHAKYLYDEFIERAKSTFLMRLSKDYPRGARLCFRDKDVYTLVEQVWKRKVYFRVFHEDVNGMNELKETALYCFWVLKLQPFYVYGSNDSMNKLNAKMAQYLLIAGVLVYAKDMSAKNMKYARAKKLTKAKKLVLNMNDSIFGDLFYSFQFRDWSKEALMDLCTGLIIFIDIKV